MAARRENEKWVDSHEQAAQIVAPDGDQATLTITSGQTTSNAMDVRGYTALGVVIPSAFTGASISFTVSDTLAGTYQALYDSTGTLVSVPVVQGRSYDLPGELAPWPACKIVSDSAEGGDRSLVVVAKG